MIAYSLLKKLLQAQSDVQVTDGADLTVSTNDPIGGSKRI